jgi:hypothetical protein
MNVFLLGVFLFLANPDCGTEHQKFKIFQLFLSYVESVSEEKLYKELKEVIREFRRQREL